MLEFIIVLTMMPIVASDVEFHVPSEKCEEVSEFLQRNAAQVDELAVQYDGVRERGLNARLQTADNLSVDLNLNFVLR